MINTLKPITNQPINVINDMIIYTDKISKIEYDAKSQNITYFEHGFANKNLLIAQFNSVLEFSNTNPVTSIITDFRQLQGSFKNIFSYLNEEFYPALKAKGLKCQAFIVSEDIINNYLTNELISGLLKKHQVYAAKFSTTYAASKWISSIHDAKASA